MRLAEYAWRRITIRGMRTGEIMGRRSCDSEQKLAQVLDLIYETPYSDQTWTPALTAVADFVGAECVDLSFLDPDLLICTRWESARIDQVAAQHYTTNYLTADIEEVHPRMPLAMSMREGQIVADIDFWSIRERSKKAFFAEYYGPLANSTECVMGTVRRRADDGLWVMLATHFKSSEPPQHDLRNKVGMLLGHVRRAVETESRIAQISRERDALTETLNRLGEAVAMLDQSGCVVKANSVAEELFRRPGGLRLAAGRRLQLPTSEARASLARALAQCATPMVWVLSATPAQEPTKIVVQRPEGHPLLLTLQPLPRELAGAFGAVAILFIDDPEARQPDRSAALRTAYKLTPAEVELAQALATGETLKEFAGRREVSYETVRRQLRRIFDKTGTRRQSELIRIVGKVK